MSLCPTDPSTAGRPVVLVVLAADDAAGSPAVARLLTAARALGEVHVARVLDHVTCAAGAPADVDGAPPADDARDVGRYGAVAVHRLFVADDGLTDSAATARAVGDTTLAVGATTVLLAARPREQEVAALVAHRLGAGLVTAAAQIHPGPDGRPVALRRSFAGTWAAEVESTRSVAVVTLETRLLPAVPVDPPVDAAVCRHRPEPSPGRSGWRLVERTAAPAGDRPALSSATVVVVGGAGTGGDFGPVEELADVLGGAVGATGVAVTSGWADAATLVGQSGVTVGPRLYVGAGVSGAVHHTNGFTSAGTVVAVNPDPEAPIFELAHLGIVGDLFEVLPQATAAIRRRRG